VGNNLASDARFVVMPGFVPGIHGSTTAAKRREWPGRACLGDIGAGPPDLELAPPYSIGNPAWVLRESSEVKPLCSDGIATSAINRGVQPPWWWTMRTGRI